MLSGNQNVDLIGRLLKMRSTAIPYNTEFLKDKLLVFSLFVENASFCILAKSGNCVIIDCGIDWAVQLNAEALAMDIDQIITTYQVKAIIITHEYFDHNKLTDVIKTAKSNIQQEIPEFRVGKLNEFSPSLLDTFLPGVKFDLLYPKNIRGGSDIHIYKQQLVYVKYGKTSLFFPGDSTPDTLENVKEPELFKPGDECTIYFWQHHGSKYNGSTTLYNLNPKCVVFSAGPRVHQSSAKEDGTSSYYGFPNQSIVVHALSKVDDSELHNVHLFPDFLAGYSDLTPEFQKCLTDSAIYTTSFCECLFGSQSIKGTVIMVDENENYNILKTPYHLTEELPAKIDYQYQNQADLISFVLFGTGKASEKQNLLYFTAKNYLFTRTISKSSFKGFANSDEFLYFLMSLVWELILTRSLLLETELAKFPFISVSFSDLLTGYKYQHLISDAMKKLFLIHRGSMRNFLTPLIGKELKRHHTGNPFKFVTFENLYLRFSNSMDLSGSMMTISNTNAPYEPIPIDFVKEGREIYEYFYSLKGVDSIFNLVVNHIKTRDDNMFLQVPSKKFLAELMKRLETEINKISVTFSISKQSEEIITFCCQCLGFVGDVIKNVYMKTGILVLPSKPPTELSMHFVEILNNKKEWKVFVSIPSNISLVYLSENTRVLSDIGKGQVVEHLANFSERFYRFRTMQFYHEYPKDYDFQKYMADDGLVSKWNPNISSAQLWRNDSDSSEESSDDDMNYGGWKVDTNTSHTFNRFAQKNLWNQVNTGSGYKGDSFF
ncbi:hypothetical protein TVAG_404850 [Trichomonas vaginalis G3]|uniref:Metallo-beta-lactamase domain-containing protein n=1 Tax=Trichomonas vaginalis (strain ATCC PRA-98 / G3) TaxID=412133 RepID=A2E303_TRIV3|nr:hypothetical protein TVAGG3_0847790 [Trichomonas vaginalis G3]EAY12939.1 hypothetical protein TVAG_404850 [Trichomonas vaginalis G3]KAI5499752.1 hypothetical protein TVAGG3_0847790 [Trichomonas vaginalis G3]|eukprot:XP_001325162.1 hypothetical protein [Trichomonas vaginalis G3]